MNIRFTLFAFFSCAQICTLLPLQSSRTVTSNLLSPKLCKRPLMTGIAFFKHNNTTVVTLGDYHHDPKYTRLAMHSRVQMSYLVDYLAAQPKPVLFPLEYRRLHEKLILRDHQHCINVPIQHAIVYDMQKGSIAFEPADHKKEAFHTLSLHHKELLRFFKKENRAAQKLIQESDIASQQKSLLKRMTKKEYAKGFVYLQQELLKRHMAINANPPKTFLNNQHLLSDALVDAILALESLHTDAALACTVFTKLFNKKRKVRNQEQLIVAQWGLWHISKLAKRLKQANIVPVCQQGPLYAHEVDDALQRYKRDQNPDKFFIADFYEPIVENIDIIAAGQQATFAPQ